MRIRLETAADLPAIRRVTTAAFPTTAEADLIERLRDDGDLVFSLVASEDNEIIGHALFSSMRSPAKTLALAPVAVVESHRRRGVAAALIREGLRLSAEAGWKAVFVLGDPAYYGRFGFDPGKAAGFRSPYAGPHLMALELQAHALARGDGDLEYPRAFARLG